MTADYSVAGGTEHSKAGGTEDFEALDADCFVVGSTDGSDAGGVEDFGAALLASFVYHHPGLLCVLPHSYKWDNVVPMSISL